jgi:hypothetical protein
MSAASVLQLLMQQSMKTACDALQTHGNNNIRDGCFKMCGCSLCCRDGGTSRGVTSPLMPFHVATHTERFATSRLRALVRLLARVTVAMDTQAARSRECLVACRADVAILGLRKGRLTGGTNVVVVLPQTRTRR